MFVEEILKSNTNTVVEGTYLINDIKLKPFFEKEGHFLTFTLQDKTGVAFAKIWDNAEYLAEQLKDVSIVSIKGRTNVYNNKTQVIVDKIKQADQGYDVTNLVVSSTKNPDVMLTELSDLLDENLTDISLKVIWLDFKSNKNFVDKFRLWPGGKGAVHHAYQHGLLEHTLSVLKILKSFKTFIEFDSNKAFLGAFLHDIGKLQAYDYNLKISMTDIGRLHEHTVLSYYVFVSVVDRLTHEGLIINHEKIKEDIGHIILSHHGTKEQHAVIKPMTLEAKLVAFADLLDSDTNYMAQQLQHNADDKGWIFDTLQNQFFFKRPEATKIRRKKI